MRLRRATFLPTVDQKRSSSGSQWETQPLRVSTAAEDVVSAAVVSAMVVVMVGMLRGPNCSGVSAPCPGL